MRKEEVVNELLKSANENGLIPTLYGVFGKSVKVSVPFSTKACDTSIDDVEFSPRAEHSLKRAGVFTIGGVIDLIADDGLLRIRNFMVRNDFDKYILSLLCIAVILFFC